jgi:hypothetical protein
MWWREHPAHYVEPSDDDWAVVPLDLEPFSDPREFARWVNDGGMRVSGRDVNCADCARAVELSWRGESQVAAARGPDRAGESRKQVEGWLGRGLGEHTFESIGQALESAGHGASAYVVVLWTNRAGGHAFNAVNWEGVVYWIDAQADEAIVEPWPPRRFLYTSEGYDETEVARTLAALFDRDGSSL